MTKVIKAVGKRNIAPVANLVRSTTNVTIGSTATFPLKASSNNRFLTFQNGAPFLVVGDSPQNMCVALSLADADIFNANRQAAGFNALLVDLIVTAYTGGRADCSTFDGILPFNTVLGTYVNPLDGKTITAYDLTTPNTTYWARVDAMINQMVARGFAVFADPLETGGFIGTAQANGTAKCQTYGTFLGNRYKSIPNMAWFSGNDWSSWRTSSTDNNLIKAIADSIKVAAPNQLHTLLLDSTGGFSSGSYDNALWASTLGINCSYTYQPTYAQIYNDYVRNAAPVFLGEANYEFEHNNTATVTNALILRHTNWWAALSGTTGLFYGNHFTWDFDAAWKTNIDTPGSAQVTILKNFLTAVAWQNLVPDTNVSHTLVTAGFGTFNATATDMTSVDYVTSGITADGRLGIAYIPTGGATRLITVNMALFAGPVTAQWFDPTNAVFSTIPGSPFTNTGSRGFTPTGNNAAGDGDWVLLLRA